MSAFPQGQLQADGPHTTPIAVARPLRVNPYSAFARSIASTIIFLA
jgi:hypothetical protein